MPNEISWLELLEKIGRTLSRDPGGPGDRVRAELKRRVVDFVNSQDGVKGDIQGEPREASVRPATAERSFTRWICDGQKPQEEGASCLVYALSQLGARNGLAAEKYTEFRDTLGALASTLGTSSLSRLERKFGMGSGYKSVSRTTEFATVEIRTDLTQSNDDLPFEKVEGEYYVYRIPVDSPKFVYRDRLVLDEARRQDRCYGGTFYSAGVEWKCTVLPSSAWLMVYMNAFGTKGTGQTPMLEVMLVKGRSEDPNRFPYFVGVLLGLDEAAENPAAARVILEKLDLSSHGGVQARIRQRTRILRRGRLHKAFHRALSGPRGGSGSLKFTPDVIASLPERAMGNSKGNLKKRHPSDSPARTSSGKK